MEKKDACGKNQKLLFPVSSRFSSFQPVLSSLFFCLLFSPPSLFLPSPPSSSLLLSKTIKVKVIDDEEYEKNKTFYVEIGEPRLVESNDTKGQDGARPS